jgi:hypothetical protein
MTVSSPFLKFLRPSDETVILAIGKLEQNGFQVVRTFDLQAARLAHSDCSCHHHGKAQCNCQMVVLLVYRGDNPPLTIAIHGTGKSCLFYLVNTPQQSEGLQLEENIREILNSEIGEKV